MCMANWSELPCDILEHLTSFLPVQDYHRFSLVCLNWRMVAKQKRYSPIQQIPWLALGTEENKRKFYNLLEDRHYYLDVPNLRDKVLCGSSYGWLFTLDRKLKFHMVNPLTRKCYDLPTPPPFLEGDLGMYEQDVPRFLEAESEDEEIHEFLREFFEESQRILVVKSIFDYDPSTRPDFTVVILYGDDDTPAFWRPGDNAWTDITGLPRALEDIAFFDGKVYCVQPPIDNNHSVIYTFEVGNDPKATKVELQVPRHGNHNYFIEDRYQNFSVNYLVVFDGKLHLVERFIERTEHRLTTEFVVHELDLEGNNYSTCQHINGHTIFLGGNAPVVINPCQFSHCMKDTIYFTDLEFGHKELYGAEDLGIYDMISKSITPYYPREVFHHTLSAPIWFTPNPW
ncbi:F-box family protein [Rhynchospora pubera]|uniref:F-box family protein n=1 Tax=Rhynchospora pubera TaxID=906938 RepID=A0AAV8DER8_9POAL|nr:F-box family protein [Rhynchospora pubera]